MSWLERAVGWLADDHRWEQRASAGLLVATVGYVAAQGLSWWLR